MCVARVYVSLLLLFAPLILTECQKNSCLVPSFFFLHCLCFLPLFNFFYSANQAVLRRLYLPQSDTEEINENTNKNKITNIIATDMYKNDRNDTRNDSRDDFVDNEGNSNDGKWFHASMYLCYISPLQSTHTANPALPV